MESDLVDVKQLFSNMMKRVQPWVLSHFIMWLDLKVAEYKVLGYMVLDKKSVYDKDQIQISRPGTSSPASATSSEHMYVVPSGDKLRNGPQTAESNRYVDLNQLSKPKSVTTSGTFIPEKADLSFPTSWKQLVQHKETNQNEIGPTNGDACDKTQDNNFHSRKPRKPGKVLHSIVNNLKQNCNKQPSDEGDESHQVEKSTSSILRNQLEKPEDKQSQRDLNGGKMSYAESYPATSVNRIQDQNASCIPKTVSDTQDVPDYSGDNTPLYKSQQFSSLISLSKSRGRRRRSSNDEITYPLITTKENDSTSQEYDEPRSQNLADFYFAQNQLDEQFAVRRAKQNYCRMTSRMNNDRDGTSNDSENGNAENTDVVRYVLKENDKERQEGFRKEIKQEAIMDNNIDDNMVTSTSSKEIITTQKSPVNPFGSNATNMKSNALNDNADTDSRTNQVNDRIVVKLEPQNDDEYRMGLSDQGDRFSNQSMSSEGDTTGFHDNLSHYEYHGDDIAEESFTNSELYGDDYVGSPHGTPGIDTHDNKMMRMKSYKKRQSNSTPVIDQVPRDPSSGKFVCELCGGMFTNRSSYFRHKRIHGEKKYRCFLCDKAFHRKEHLQSHIHRHTKYFPLKCCKCPFESHSLDEASAHFHSVHGDGLDRKESP